MNKARYCLLVLLTFVFALIGLTGVSQNPDGFDVMLNETCRGTVPWIYSDSLAGLLESEDWLVIDAREIEEYEVSHLSNALFVGYKNFSPEKLGEWSKASNIVVYCSVGYRSEKVGENLIQAGYENVFNLRGGIFEWINSGHPVFNDAGRRVKIIHPYNASWGKWVNDYKKVYE